MDHHTRSRSLNNPKKRRFYRIRGRVRPCSRIRHNPCDVFIEAASLSRIGTRAPKDGDDGIGNFTTTRIGGAASQGRDASRRTDCGTVRIDGSGDGRSGAIREWIMQRDASPRPIIRDATDRDRGPCAADPAFAANHRKRRRRALRRHAGSSAAARGIRIAIQGYGLTERGNQSRRGTIGG